MGSSSPGHRTFEAQDSSSRISEDPETDSNEEDDPINLTLNHSVLTDDPLGEQPHPQ